MEQNPNKPTLIEKLIENRQIIYFVLFIILAVILGCCSYWGVGRSHDIGHSENIHFKDEFAGIKHLPGVVYFDYYTFSKLNTFGYGGRATTGYKYRTQLSSEELFNHYSQELSKKGWVYIGTEERSFLSKIFKRNKMTAELVFEPHNNDQNVFHIIFEGEY